MNTELKLELQLGLFHADLYWLKSHPHVGLIQSKSTYIPIEEFKQIFSAVEDFARKHSIRRIIFDKTTLRVFHQPSMEWYFTEWKAQMAELGVVEHVKILPDNEIFRQSVKLGREAINRDYPDAVFHNLKIVYANSIKEAVLL
jgi:hypothetical protein